MHVKALTQPWEHDLAGPDVVRAARTADELGFDLVLIPEHFVVPNSHTELSGDHYFHSVSAQGVVLGATERIRTISSIALLPLQHPIVTAKSIATLDWLSGGRVMASFGVGWLKEEFDALGVPFRERGAMANEYLAALFELWQSDEPTFRGKYVSFSDVAFAPKPVQRPHPPVWIGGGSDAALHRAARFADGWMPHLTPIADLARKVEQIHVDPEFVERPFDVFFAPATLRVGPNHEVLDPVDARTPGTAQEMVDLCAMLAASGVTYVCLPLPTVSGLDELLDHLQWVASEVVSRVP